MSNPTGSSPLHPRRPRPITDPTPLANLSPLGSTGHNPLVPEPPSALTMMSRPLLSSNNRMVPSKNDAALYFTSDDRVLSKHVEDTHFPDDSRIDEVRPLFYLVKELFAQTSHTVQESVPGALARKELVLGRTNMQSSIGIPNLALITERISSVLASCRGWGATSSDAHETTMAVLKLLSHFSWESKMIFSLTAFAMSYGEFWLLAQSFSSNELAKSMAVLKQIPLAMQHSGAYKNIFEAIDELIQAMLDVTDCIIQFKEIPSVYVPEDDPAIKAARTQVPIAVYWTTRSAVTAATQITALTNPGYEYIASATDVYELQNRTHKLRTIHQHFMMILKSLKDRIDEKREYEAYEMLRTVIYNMNHIDNMPVLSRIIIQDELPALYDGANKGRAHLDILRRKNVLLLLSDLNISSDELSILEQIYTDSKIHAYEILWLPIIDQTILWTDDMQNQFERLRSTMPWYTAYHPLKITKAFIKFARLDWSFRSKPVLVVLDPRGKVLSPNAIHMMWIWGSNAFPFTTEREHMLWNEEVWRLELLIDGIDQTILDWIREDKFIFIYGGDDVELIRRFTKEARAVANAAGIKLEMMYVGKANKKEVVRKICNAIISENMSNCWQDPPMVWFFWKRIESMLFSKMELKKADDHTDVVIQEIKKLLSYDRFPGGWAVLSKGSELILHGQLSAIVTALQRYESEEPYWKNEIPRKTFSEAFKHVVVGIHVKDLPCCRFEFPAIADPLGLLCPECHRSMEKHTTFVCCHEGGLAPVAAATARAPIADIDNIKPI